jgi:hypothetical protein
LLKRSKRLDRVVLAGKQNQPVELEVFHHPSHGMPYRRNTTEITPGNRPVARKEMRIAEPTNERFLYIDLKAIIVDYDRCIRQLRLKCGHKTEKLGRLPMVKDKKSNSHRRQIPF